MARLHRAAVLQFNDQEVNGVTFAFDAFIERQSKTTRRIREIAPVLPRRFFPTLPTITRDRRWNTPFAVPHAIQRVVLQELCWCNRWSRGLGWLSGRGRSHGSRLTCLVGLCRAEQRTARMTLNQGSSSGNNARIGSACPPINIKRRGKMPG